MTRTDAEKMADEAASIRLLSGYSVEKQDTFPFPQGDAEAACRAALARLVRDQMKGFSGELLALAIDPETPSEWHGMRPTRKINFERQGRQSSLFVERMIVQKIQEMRRSETNPNANLKTYVAEIERLFGLGRSRIYEIWNAHEKEHDRMREAARDAAIARAEHDSPEIPPPLPDAK